MKKDKTLTKRHLVQIVNRECGIRQPEALKAVNAVFDAISKALVAGGHCEFRDFGVFETIRHKPRIGRNPRFPDREYSVPARRVIRFKTGRVLRAEMDKADAAADAADKGN